ncbi:MAG: hypothetical protein WCK96_10475 [Methylococcales bacterium]
MSSDGTKNSDMAELEKSIQEKMQKLQSDKIDSTTATTVQKTSSDIDWWSVQDAMTISASVLVFGCFIMLLATILLYKGTTSHDVLKLFGTMVIVISAVFLVVAGYSDTQIAPVIGLLGTIAGYLLGSRDTTEKEKEKEEKDKSKDK